MTDGTYNGLDDAAVLERLRATYDSDQPNHVDQPDHDDAGEAPQRHDQPPDNQPDDEELDHDEAGATAAQQGRGPAGEPVAQRRPSGAGMELRVRLSTLLGGDDYPGELAGWGPVPAGLARAQALAMSRGQWRFALTDAHGQLLHGGITHARPHGWPTRTAGCRQIVELQIPAITLHVLARTPATLGDWGPVVNDLAHQHNTAQQAAAGDPTRRFPGTALRRHIQIRDRSCIMIGCRAIHDARVQRAGSSRARVPRRRSRALREQDHLALKEHHVPRPLGSRFRKSAQWRLQSPIYDFHAPQSTRD
jgi:hypothetical protein